MIYHGISLVFLYCLCAASGTGLTLIRKLSILAHRQTLTN